MPAARRKFERKNNNVKRGKTLFYLLIIIILGLVFLVYSSISGKSILSKDSKAFLVISSEDGSVVVAVFDPKLHEITNIIIPANTEVEVAKRLGVWKLGKVWQLGKNEGMRGDLLAATLRRHFKFPVVYWAGSGALGFTKGSINGMGEALVGSYETNLDMGDKIALTLFALEVKNNKRIYINLADTSYLEKTILKDGEEGYVVARNFSQGLLSVFSDDRMTTGSYKVEIKDASGDAQIAGDIGELVEVLGAKVASVVKKDESDFGCIITGNEKSVIEDVARILSCEQTVKDDKSSFDLTIDIGSQFVKTY